MPPFQGGLLHIRVLKLGKPKDPFSILAQNYKKRCQAFIPCEEYLFKDLEAFQRRQHLEKWLQVGSLPIVLKEGGKQYSSKELSQWLESCLLEKQYKGLHFLIGGPYGLGEKIPQKASMGLSLSKGTLPSDLAWCVLWEQLYRALSILNKSPYHHG